MRALAFLLVLAPACSADNLQDATAELVREIIARAGAGTAISLDFRNISSLAESSATAAQNAVTAELRKRGMQVVGPQQAVAELRLTMSENTQGLLWIGELRQGKNTEVVFMPVPRAEGSALGVGASGMVLRKTAIWSQEVPMLDVAVIRTGDRSLVLVLDPEKVVLNADVRGGQGQSARTFPIPRSRSWPRDLRGRVVLRNDHLFDIYLPGMRCASDALGTAMECRESDDPWPLADAAGATGFFSPVRNFFTGALSGGAYAAKNVATFFSAARVNEGGRELWLFAALDGRVHLYNGISEVAMNPAGFGSDIAAVNSGCGGGTQVLATRPGDATQPDEIGAYEIVARQAIPVSAPVNLAGPVTALWAASDGTSATAIARNLQTGRYEAFSLSLACQR